MQFMCRGLYFAPSPNGMDLKIVMKKTSTGYEFTLTLGREYNADKECIVGKPGEPPQEVSAKEADKLISSKEGYKLIRWYPKCSAIDLPSPNG